MNFFNKLLGTEEKKHLQQENKAKSSYEDVYHKGKLIKEHTFVDDRLWKITEYKNDIEFKVITYWDNGEVQWISEYEDGEEVKTTVNSEDSKVCTITEYEDGEEIKNIRYIDGQITSISESKNGEEFRETSYKDGQISLLKEVENNGNSTTKLYQDGQIYSISEYDEDYNDIRSIIYENSKIKILIEYDGDEEVRINYKDNKILDITKFEEDKEIIFTCDNDEHSKIIEEYEKKYSNYLADNINVNNTNSGYVYVLVNSSINDMVKIGKTTRTSEERAKEISSTTGVPTPFVVAFDCHFNDCSIAEKYIHDILEKKNHRTSKQREFFNISSKDAISIIMKAKEKLDG